MRFTEYNQLLNALIKMTLSNTEQEMLWIDAWNELSDLRDLHSDAFLLLPEYHEVTEDQAQEWIQNAAYESYKTEFKIDYYKGKKSIFISKVPA